MAKRQPAIAIVTNSRRTTRDASKLESRFFKVELNSRVDYRAWVENLRQRLL